MARHVEVEPAVAERRAPGGCRCRAPRSTITPPGCSSRAASRIAVAGLGQVLERVPEDDRRPLALDLARAARRGCPARRRVALQPGRLAAAARAARRSACRRRRRRRAPGRAARSRRSGRRAGRACGRGSRRRRTRSGGPGGPVPVAVGGGELAVARPRVGRRRAARRAAGPPARAGRRSVRARRRTRRRRRDQRASSGRRQIAQTSSASSSPSVARARSPRARSRRRAGPPCGGARRSIMS